MNTTAQLAAATRLAAAVAAAWMLSGGVLATAEPPQRSAQVANVSGLQQQHPTAPLPLVAARVVRCTIGRVVRTPCGSPSRGPQAPAAPRQQPELLLDQRARRGCER